MKALYLEPDEEITSVVDRLKEIDDEEVAIVVPKRAGLLQSIVNLKLLRYQAEQQKKRISLVTTDKTGRNLASAVGLTVHQKLPEGSKGKAPSKPTESAVKEPAQEIPIKFRKEPPPSEPERPGTGPDISDIGFKRGTTPEVVQRTIGEDEGIDVAEPPETVAEKVAAKAPDQPKTPKPRLSQVKLPKVKLPNVKLPNLRKTAPSKPKAGGGKRWFNWKIAVAALLVVLLGGGTAAAVVLPKATVTVTPKTDPLNLDVPLTFSAKAPAVDPEGNVIPAKAIEVTREGSRQVAATGHSEGGEKASGDITVVNTLPRNQSLVARTRFQTSDGKVFRAQAGVVVPAGGQTTVRVVADDGGVAGNLPAGTRLSVPGLRGSEAVYGQVDSALTGGSDSATTNVSASDVERAKTELAAQVASEGVEEARGKLAVGYKIDDRIVATTVLSSDTTPAVGAAADKFSISGRVRVTYFTYQEQDLKQVLDPDLKAKVPSGAELTESRTETFIPSQSSNDQLTGTFRVETASAANVSKDQIKAQIKGKKPGAAETELERSGTVKDVTIKLFPFWVVSVPDRFSKIQINFRSGAGPSTLPTPTATTTPTAPSGTQLPQI